MRRKARRGRVAVVVLALTAVLAPGIGQSATQFICETVDATGNAGQCMSLALDVQGSPCISYTALATDYDYDLMYASKSGGAWTIEAVEVAGDAGAYTSLALDSQGNPHISYWDRGNAVLKYASKSGGVWTLETAGPANAYYGVWTSLELDALENPHISYMDDTSGLTYMTKSGDVWMRETVDPGAGPGSTTSLSLDGAGNPHISYYGGGNLSLTHATRSGGVWTTETVDGAYCVGQYSSLALDAYGNAHIAYTPCWTTDLLYASEIGGVWTLEAVYAAGPAEYVVSLVLDADGDPHITYSAYDPQGEMYASKSGGVWTIEPVDLATRARCYTSLALDGYGNPHISYWDFDNLDLKYAEAAAALINSVTPESEPTCISTVHPCNTVSFAIARTDSEPMRAFSVTFELSAELALCSGLGSVQEGDYLSAAVGDLGNPYGTYFEVTDNGGGSYTVDGTILGEPCGATAVDGTLFTVAVTNAGGDGTGTVTVTEVSLRDCGNPFVAIPAMAGAPASITIDNAPPVAIASLTAAQLKSGNDVDGTTVITLTWPAVEAGATVKLFRKGFGAYPEFDDGGGAVPDAPADSAAALLAGWTSLGTQVSPYSDETDSERDFYYYVGFVTDACGNVSAVSNQTSGTLNYHLGDVMPSAATPPFGDNQVEFLDVSFLGDHYGVLSTNPLYTNILDIGPTTDSSTNGRPTTDNKIQFEDLIILAINYGGVSKPGLSPAGVDRNAVALDMAPGADGIEAVVTLSSTGAVQGVSLPLLWNAEAVEPIAVRSGELVDRQAGRTLVLSPEPGTVDAAVFGSTFAGTGELAVVTFRVIGSGDPGIRFGEVIARDGENRPVVLGTTVESRDLPVTPVVTRLLPSAPNPFLGSTQIRFALAEPGEAVVRIYGMDGRLVRTLIEAALPAGERSVTWDGRDDLGRVAAAGTYIVRFQAAGVSEAQRVMRLR